MLNVDVREVQFLGHLASARNREPIDIDAVDRRRWVLAGEEEQVRSRPATDLEDRIHVAEGLNSLNDLWAVRMKGRERGRLGEKRTMLPVSRAPDDLAEGRSEQAGFEDGP
jgi:hypothetical protein